MKNFGTPCEKVVYHRKAGGRIDDVGSRLMRKMALNVLAYIVENAAGMKFPTLKSRAKIGLSDKNALSQRAYGRFLEVDDIENAKN